MKKPFGLVLAPAIATLLAVLFAPSLVEAQQSGMTTQSWQTLRAMFVPRVGAFGLPGSASDPFTCDANTVRAMYYNTGSNVLYFCNGTAWTLITTGAGGITIGSTAITGGTDTRVLFDNAGVVGESANFTWVSPALTIGAAGVTGALKLPGLTSGTTTIQAPAIAGTTTVTMPNASSTLPIFGQQITFTGPSAARSYALVDAADTFAFLGQTQSFTGVNTFSQDAASTNTVLYPAICQRTSSGTPAIAMGCGFNFILENASNVNTTAGSVETVWTDPINATEDSATVFKQMTAGAAAAETWRMAGAAGVSSLTSPLTKFSFGNASSVLNYNNSTGNSWVFSSGNVQVTANGLTAATMSLDIRGELRSASSSYTWSNAQVVALGPGLTGDITVATLPAKTQVLDAAVVITGTAAGVATLTVSCGDAVGATPFINYIVPSDAKAAVNTFYGDAVAERGTSIDTEFYYLPSYTGTTLVTCHFISTVQTLDATTGSTGRVILTTRLLP